MMCISLMPFFWCLYHGQVFLFLNIFLSACDVPAPDVPCISTGLQVLEKYSFSEDALYPDIFKLLLMCAIFHVLSFICITLRTRR